MSFFKHLFGSDEPEGDPVEETSIAPTQEQSIAAMTPDGLLLLKSSSCRSITLPAVKEAAVMADALIPVVANAAQAANEFGMAVVKFPEGVGWADLCVRHADGWNLLANIKDGKFNEMAAIKQAGLQPAAVANLALQGAAVAVGMAYMNQINAKLDGLQLGIEAIQRDMERERDAELKAAYDALMRLTLKYEEFGASPEKRVVGLQIIENATHEATKAWNYQLDCIRDFSDELRGKKRLSEDKISEAVERLSLMEARAATAFQLVIVAQQIGMRFENDYTYKRIDTDREIIHKMAHSFSSVRGDAHLKLSIKISKVGGKPLAVADLEENGFKASNAALCVLHGAAANVNRLNPVRMRNKAKVDVAEKRARLQDVVSTENVVCEIASMNDEQLEELRFAFNEADSMAISNDGITLFKSASEESAEETA